MKLVAVSKNDSQTSVAPDSRTSCSSASTVDPSSASTHALTLTSQLLVRLQTIKTELNVLPFARCDNFKKSVRQEYFMQKGLICNICLNIWEVWIRGVSLYIYRYKSLPLQANISVMGNSLWIYAGSLLKSLPI